MPQLPAKITTSDRQPLTQMSIAFLLDHQDKAKSIDLDETRDHCDSASTPSQVPASHANPSILPCDQTKMAEKLFDPPLSQTDLPHCSNGHYTPQTRSVESAIGTSSPGSGHASSNGTESSCCDLIKPSNELSTSFHEPLSSVDCSEPYYRHRCHNHHTEMYMSAEVPTHEPRSTRLSYNEEQKFFIMYHRVVKQLSWPQVEDKFAQLFNLRSKDGLTSAYYRIRGSWGMEQVLKNQARPEDDLSTIERKADCFSSAFLEKIGYLD